MNRRTFINTSLALLLLNKTTLAQTRKKQKRGQGVDGFTVSAQGLNDKHFSLSAFNLQTQQVTTILSGFRGHGLAKHPQYKNTVVMFGRRPSTTSAVFNIDNKKKVAQFNAIKNRNFMGHGCFSDDGTLLFTSEVNTQTGQGKIGIRDAKTYQYKGEFESYGIGLHEIVSLPNQQTIIAANGGILTHPKTGRKKLNLNTMQANLSYINANTGELLEQHTLPESKASIRHLAVAQNGTLAIALQVQRQAMSHNKTVSLCAVHKRGKAISLLSKPNTIINKLNDYIGSVAIDEHNNNLLFTSPKGNLLAIWDMESLNFKGYYALHDVSGVTTANNKIILSNSSGSLRQLDSKTMDEYKSLRWKNSNLHWDNHMIVI